MRIKVSTVISITGVLVLFIIAWKTGGDPAPQWNPPPTTGVGGVVNWCTPVAVPLYQNGTDCQ